MRNYLLPVLFLFVLIRTTTSKPTNNIPTATKRISENIKGFL